MSHSFTAEMWFVWWRECPNYYYLVYFFHTLQKVCMLETLDDEYQDLCQVVAVLIAPLIFAQFLSIKAYHLISAG